MSSWGEQFAVGDQSIARQQFASSGYAVCPCCGSKRIGQESHVAGCRHNGDGYGTHVYTCSDCQWRTSFLYDESGDSYYYELSQRCTADSAPKAYVALTATDRESFAVARKFIPEDHLRTMLLVKGYDPKEVEEFIGSSSLRETVINERVPMIPITTWSNSLLSKYQRIVKLVTKEDAVYNMKQDGLEEADIERFFRAISLGQPLKSLLPQSAP